MRYQMKTEESMLLKQVIEVFGSQISAIEFIFLVHGLKSSARIPILEQKKEALVALCASFSFHVRISEKRYSPFKGNGYCNSATEAPGFGLSWRQNSYFEAYISPHDNISRELEACCKNNDHRRVGALLGYPSCCVDFFMIYFALGQLNSMDFSPLIPAKTKRANWYTNTFARPFGATIIDHFPCKYNCQETGLNAILRLEFLALKFPHILKEIKQWSCGTAIIGNTNRYAYFPEIFSKGNKLIASGTEFLMDGDLYETEQENSYQSILERIRGKFSPPLGEFVVIEFR